MEINLKKGFTLIELLVVVAIIGILASIVLASLNSARIKGSDAAVKSNLANMRAQAAIYYDNQVPNNYATSTNAPDVATCTVVTTLFWLDPGVKSQLSTAISAGGGLRSCATVAGAAGAYAVLVQLKSNSLNAWCVDSSSVSKLETLATADQAGLNAKISAAALCL